MIYCDSKLLEIRLKKKLKIRININTQKWHLSFNIPHPIFITFIIKERRAAERRRFNAYVLAREPCNLAKMHRRHTYMYKTAHISYTQFHIHTVSFRGCC